MFNLFSFKHLSRCVFFLNNDLVSESVFVFFRKLKYKRSLMREIKSRHEGSYLYRLQCRSRFDISRHNCLYMFELLLNDFNESSSFVRIILSCCWHRFKQHLVSFPHNILDFCLSIENSLWLFTQNLWVSKICGRSFALDLPLLLISNYWNLRFFLKWRF